VKPFAYVPATDLEEALELLARHGDDAHLMAGGTAVILLLKQGLIEPAVVVGLGGLSDLGRIALDGDTLEIGALSTLHCIERDPVVLRHAPAVASAVGRVATVRVRNQATIGGNLVHADPAQDPPPILLVHDAEVVLRGPSGDRIVPLVDFFVDVFETSIEPDEILTRVRIPAPSPTSRFEYVKFLPRTVDDYATVSVAVRVDVAPDGTIGDVRIALGNAGAVPFRALDAEAALRGEAPTPARIAEVADLAAEGSDPGDDIRGTAAYKREMVRVWTGRALDRALDPAETRR
jgi:carbon-monoxide dehydrogenase medium subunit